MIRLVLVCLLVFACASYDHIDRQDLLTNAKTKVQTQNGVWIYTNMVFEEGELERVMLDLDNRLEGFIDCMWTNFGIDVDVSLLLETEFPIVLVPEAFECKFHNWCGGEWHAHYIILAKDTPDGDNFKFWEEELCERFVARNCKKYEECI